MPDTEYYEALVLRISCSVCRLILHYYAIRYVCSIHVHNVDDFLKMAFGKVVVLHISLQNSTKLGENRRITGAIFRGNIAVHDLKVYGILVIYPVQENFERFSIGRPLDDYEHNLFTSHSILQPP